MMVTPEFMYSPEFKQYDTGDMSDPVFTDRLKPGAPEWLQKEFKEYKKDCLDVDLEIGDITKEAYDAAMARSIFYEG